MLSEEVSFYSFRKGNAYGTDQGDGVGCFRILNWHDCVQRKVCGHEEGDDDGHRRVEDSRQGDCDILNLPYNKAYL